MSSQEVVEAYRLMNSGCTAEQHAKCNQYLMSFQEREEAWGVAIEILSVELS